MIFITGATGHLGKATCEFLTKKTGPQNIAALVRNTEKANDLKLKGIEVGKGDYDNYASLTNAFKGIDMLYFISGNDVEKREQQHFNIIKAAKETGVKQIIYINFQRSNEDLSSPTITLQPINKLIMKPVLFVFFLLSGTFSLTYAQIPDFQLPLLNGKNINYSSIKGEKVTIIDFWATWCQPCVRSIPKLVEIFDEYRDKGVQVLGINVDSPRNTSKVKPFASSKGITYPILLDSNGDVMSSLGLTALPSILIVDRNDKIITTFTGFLPGEEEEVRKILDKLIAD